MKQDGGLKCHMSPPSGRRCDQPVVTRASGLAGMWPLLFLNEVFLFNHCSLYKYAIRCGAALIAFPLKDPRRIFLLPNRHLVSADIPL